ncbi:MAG: GNAT family N-acetyltransferase, partial [Burkholderiaceae bacterium]
PRPARRASQESAIALAAARTGVARAAVYAVFRSWTPMPDTRLAAAARGQDLAERLMRWLIDEAWRAGCYKAMLLSGAQRDGAHHLYQKLGFDGDVERGFALKRPDDRI